MLLTSSTVAARNACLSLESIVDLVEHKAGSQGALEREVLWEGLAIEGTFPTFRHKKFIVPDHSLGPPQLWICVTIHPELGRKWSGTRD